jgi:diguanylate cyclase (GGDEF)-like protein
MILAPSAQLFPELFPFHWVVNADMVITQVGVALQRLLGAEVVGSSLGQQLSWLRPGAVEFSLEGMGRIRSKLSVLQFQRVPLQLKGEVVVDRDHVFFLGSPVVHSLAELGQLGLGLADLPRHDGLLDSVLLHQIHELTLQDKVSRRTSELAQLATHDELTGVANRRLFRRDIQAQLQLHRRLAAPLSLMMLDLDRFKRFNDAHGHLAGDSCLHAAAQRLVSLVGRGGDRVYRYGGEEFAVLLPHTDHKGAEALAARIVEGFASAPLPLSEHGLVPSITLSVGIACTESVADGDLTDTLLISRADQAMYRAKHAGRNCFVTYSPNRS